MKHRKPTPARQKLGLRVSKKLAVGATALATVFGGLAVASVSAQASTDRNSYADTVGNPTFEAARKKYGLTKEMPAMRAMNPWLASRLRAVVATGTPFFPFLAISAPRP